jgi:hypothetical protein
LASHGARDIALTTHSGMPAKNLYFKVGFQEVEKGKTLLRGQRWQLA